MINKVWYDVLFDADYQTSNYALGIRSMATREMVEGWARKEKFTQRPSMAGFIARNEPDTYAEIMEQEEHEAWKDNL